MSHELADHLLCRLKESELRNTVGWLQKRVAELEAENARLKSNQRPTRKLTCDWRNPPSPYEESET